MAPLRVRILYNPRSGGLGGERVAEELADELRRKGCEVATRSTDREHVGYRTIEAGAQDVLVLQGGDGTVHDAINVLPREVLQSTPLAFHGQGTVNVLSLATRQARSPQAFAADVLAGRTISIPLAKVAEQRWLLFCEAGFLAGAMVLVDRWSKSPFMSWCLAGSFLRRARKKALVGLAALWSASTTWGRRLRIDPLPDPLDLDQDPDPPSELGADDPGLGFSDVLLVRVREYGGRLTMPVEGQLEDASFQLLGFRSRWPATHLGLLAIAAAGRMPQAANWLVRHGLLVRVTTQGVRIRATGGRDVPRYADAETLDTPFPLDCRIDESEVLHLIVPDPSSKAGPAEAPSA